MKRKNGHTPTYKNLGIFSAIETEWTCKVCRQYFIISRKDRHVAGNVTVWKQKLFTYRRPYVHQKYQDEFQL